MAAPSFEPQRAMYLTSPASRSRRRRRSQRERTLLAVEILTAYAQAKLALRRAPIETAVASLRERAPQEEQQAGAASLEEARSLGWAVARLLRFVPGDTRCLARSLVVTRLLARRGIQAKLVIGARTEPEFLAHAWVEHAGDPVLDPGDGSFGRLVEL